jgi:hypothetical protein
MNRNATVTKGGNMTPNQLAATLAGTENAERVGKAFVRPFLRRNYTRDNALKGSSWDLSDEQIALVTSAWKAKQAGKPFDVAEAQKALRAKPNKAVSVA